MVHRKIDECECMAGINIDQAHSFAGDNTIRKALFAGLLVLLVSVVGGVKGWGQTTIFSENMGTPSGTTTIATYSTGTAPATFQNKGTLIFTGTGDLRNTTNSSGYTGASGNGNVFITNSSGTNFQISSINTSSYSSASLSLSFGIYKSTTSGTGSDLVVETSTDGSSYSSLSYTALPTGAGTATWFSRTASGTIPSSSTLYIRFRQTGTTTQYRIDDVSLVSTVTSYTVTFNANGGTGSMSNQTASTATALTSNSFTRSGYTFSKWNTASDGSGTDYANGASYPFTANATLYAQWTVNNYSVSYNGNTNTGGTPPSSQNGNYATSVTVQDINTLVKTGYSFSGWNTQADGNGTNYATGASYTIPASNTTLYAKWTVNSYTVSYNGNTNDGGTAPSSQSGNYNTSISLAGAGTLSKTGNVFAGWNTAADGSGTSYSAGASFNIPATNTTLFAQWTVGTSYTVIYNGNGNSGGSVPTDVASPYISGATVTVLGNTGSLVKTGYTFAGWNTQAGGGGTSYSPANTFTINANTILYAQWTINSYNVVYDGNANSGGTAPTTQSGNYNSSITLSAVGTLVKTGYTFTGWNTASNGSGTPYTAGASFTVPASNTTLYAQWTINSYSVTYDGNSNTGGTAPATQNGNYNTSVMLATVGTLTRTGYSFGGWNTAADGSGTSYAAGASFTIPASNTTLYAKWTINSYNVVYDGNGNTGGTAPGTQSANYNSSVTLAGAGTLAKTGYTFNGWNTASNGSGTSFAAAASFTIPAANTTLYAQWTVASYNVVYNGNGNTAGVAPTTQTANYGSSVTISGVGTLVKTGYNFNGWNSASDGSGTSYAAGAGFTIPASNTNLYAQWTCAITTAPTATAASNTAGTSFTANWNVVAGATGYYVDVYTATAATDLFISEYIEGSSNNKYIEIYNGTGASVNLANYELRSFANGSSTPTSATLSGTLANGTTIVYKNSAATIYGGTTTTATAVNFNGNDAVALYKTTTSSYVDIVGRIGEDPGTAWTSGSLSTLDKTLVRKATVFGGVTTNPSSGFPTLATEWDVYATDVVSNLGSHTFSTYVSGFQNAAAATNSLNVTGLTAGVTYYYVVRASNGSCSSPNSNQITVLPATMSVTPTSVTGLNYTVGSGPSASGQLTNITASNLWPTTGTITVSPALGTSSNFEVSIDGTSWGTSMSYSYSSASFNTSNPTIYFRLKAGLGINSYGPETINLSGGGATASFTVSGTVAAGGCSQLLISEYHEGTGTEKYIEIYNPTSSPVALSGYRLAQYNNGAASPTYTLSLSGTLTAYTTYVIAYSSATNSSSANLSTSSSVMTFNGNDVIALQTSGGSNIDVIGTIGSSADFAKDVVLRRLTTITNPVTTYNSSEWTSVAADDVTNLGSYASNCQVISPCTTPNGPTTVSVSRDATNPGTTINGTITAPASSVPSHYLVVYGVSSTLGATPTDATNYSAGASFGSGTVLGSYTSLSFTASSLTAGTTYYFFVFGYNNNSCSGGPMYNATSSNANVATKPNNGTITEGCTGTTTHEIKWTPPSTGGYDGVVIMARQGATPNVPGSDFNSLPSASLDWNSASTISSSKLIYKGTAAGAASLMSISNLTNGLNYTFKAYTYIGATGTIYSDGTSASQTIQFNDVSSYGGLGYSGQVVLNWSNLTGSCFDDVMIVASENNTSLAPSGTTYSANATYGSGATFQDGYVVYKGTGTTMTVTNLTNGTPYFFKIFVRKGTSWSVGIEISVTPNTTTVFRPGELFFCGFDAVYNSGFTQDMYMVASLVPILQNTNFSIVNSRYEAGASANVRTNKWGGAGDDPKLNPGVLQVTYTGASPLAAGCVIRINMDDGNDGVANIYVNGVDMTSSFTTSLPYGLLTDPNIAQSSPDQIYLVQGSFSSDGTIDASQANYVLNGKVLFGMTIGRPWVDLTVACSGGDGFVNSDNRESRLPFEIQCFNIERTSQAKWGYYRNNKLHNGTIREILGDVRNTANTDYWNFSNSGSTSSVDFTISYSSTIATNAGLVYNVATGNPSGNWIGDVSTNWFDCANWAGLSVPDSTDNVYINTNSVADALIDDAATYASYYSGIAYGKNISISANRLLYFSNTGSDSLKVSGNLFLNGGLLDAKSAVVKLKGDYLSDASSAVDPGTSKFILHGTSQQTVSNIGADVPFFYNMEVSNSAGVVFDYDAQLNNQLTLTSGIVTTAASPNGLLTLGTSAPAVAGSPGVTAYVNGPLAKQFAVGASTEYFYPVGKSSGGYPTVYNPCYVVPASIVGATTTFTSEYFAGAHQAQAIMGTNVLGITNKEYWDISKSPSNASTARVKLYYDNPGSGNWIYYTNASSSPYYTNAVDPCWYCNVAVVHRETATNAWNLTKLSSFSATDPEYRFYTNDGWIYSAAVSSFSPFTIGYSYNMILPVKLLSFTGKLQNADGKLDWKIADATDLKDFVLEYSRDGNNYLPLANIPSNGTVNYAYLHKALPAGAHYYRLLVREKNGNTYYSNVVLLSVGKLKTYVIGTSPMQGGNQVTTLVFSAKAQKMQVRITDVLGRQLFDASKNLAPGTNQWQISTANLPRGLYFLSLQSEDGCKEIKRFMKD